MTPVETTIRNGAVTLPPPLRKAWQGARVSINANEYVIVIQKHPQTLPVPVSGKERLAIWEKARGMWKSRKPDPIRELAKMRKEWDRPLPPLNIK